MPLPSLARVRPTLSLVIGRSLETGRDGTLTLPSAVIIFRTVLFRSIPLVLYKLLYTGTLLSYSIVCYKAYGFPQANAAFVRKAFVDENVQYALLAVWW